MSYHTSESYIEELSEKVRGIGERHSHRHLAAKAVLDTVSDRTKPVEYRKQLLLHFLNRHKDVENASH